MHQSISSPFLVRQSEPSNLDKATSPEKENTRNSKTKLCFLENLWSIVAPLFCYHLIEKCVIGFTIGFLTISPKSLVKLDYYYYYYYYYSLIWAFHISVRWWFFTGVWVTASLLKSPGLFSVFWPFSIMLSFRWSPPVRQLPSPPVPLVFLLLLFQMHEITIDIIVTCLFHIFFSIP